MPAMTMTHVYRSGQNEKLAENAKSELAKAGLNARAKHWCRYGFIRTFTTGGTQEERGVPWRIGRARW